MENGKSKGCGMVVFNSNEDARRAVSILSLYVFGNTYRLKKGYPDSLMLTLNFGGITGILVLLIISYLITDIGVVMGKLKESV